MKEKLATTLTIAPPFLNTPPHFLRLRCESDGDNNVDAESY